MGVLEEHVIRVRHESDARDMEKIRADARKTAHEIDRQFERAAGEVDQSAKDMAASNERAAAKTSEVWTGALRQVGARLADFGIQAAQAIATYVADAYEEARTTDTFAQTLGVATPELMALEKGFERVRVPVDNTREAIKTFRENLGELKRLGTGPARDALGSLGLSVDDFIGKTPTEQIKLFAEALRDIPDAEKRTSIAIEAMGEDGQRLLPALLDGAAGIDALTEAARDAGQVLDQDTIEKTRELDRALGDLRGRVDGVALRVIEGFLPVAEDAASGMESWVKENDAFIEQDLPDLLDTTVAALRAIADTGVEAAGTFHKMAKAAGGLAAELGPVGEQLADIVKFNATGGIAGYVARTGVASELQGGLGAAIEANRPRGAGVDNPLNADILGAVESAGRRVRGALFEASERAKAGGGSKGGRGRKTDQDELDRELVAAFAEANPDLVAELTRLGGRFGATDQGLFESQLSAAQALRKGGNVAAARKAGLGTLGRVTDTADIDRQVSQDPLSQLFGIEALPEVSPGDISQDRAPDVLTATINNTFTIEQNFAIDGAARPDLIPDQITDAFRSLFANEVERQSNYVKVPFAR